MGVTPLYPYKYRFCAKKPRLQVVASLKRRNSRPSLDVTVDLTGNIKSFKSSGHETKKRNNVQDAVYTTSVNSWPEIIVKYVLKTCTQSAAKQFFILMTYM